MQIDSLLAAARDGRSGALVIDGEPGIGKTALCRYALDRAAGFTRVEAHGVESESEISCAGLSELLGPLRMHIGSLPQQPWACLASALGEGPAAPSDPFRLGLAVLLLLAEASESRPLLAVVDDAQWLDAVSLDALVFAGRRLDRESVVLLLAARTNGGGHVLEDVPLPHLTLSGLDASAAAHLVSDARGTTVAPAVAGELVAGTGGNPLALLEVTEHLHENALSGAVPLPDPLPLGPAVGAAFARRIAEMTEPVRRALVVVAASETRLMSHVSPALSTLGLGAAELEAAERAGLIDLDGVSVVFVHPLVRAAAYQQAPPEQRRVAHRALAEAAARAGDYEHQTWHRAAAAVGPDEAVAAALEAVAVRAASRAGAMAGASALERAALLSPIGPDRARRFVAAAGALLMAGRPERVKHHIDEALRLSEDALMRADAARVLGQLVTLTESPSAGYRILSEAARAVETHDPVRAGWLWFTAAWPAAMDGEQAALEAGQETARLARQTGDEALERLAGVVLSLMLLVFGRTAEGEALLEDCEPRPAHESSVIEPTNAQCLLFLERYEQARTMLAGVIARARDSGEVASLPQNLTFRSELEFHTGSWIAALASASEAVRLAEVTDEQAVLAFALSFQARVEAGRGDEDDCRTHVAAALDVYERGRTGRMIRAFAGSSLTLLAVGLGRTEDAEAVFDLVVRPSREMGFREPSVFRAGGDVVELLLRAGREDEALELLREFEADSELTERVWAKAAALRCRALSRFAEEDIEGLFEAAMALHDQTDTPFERARTLLCWGEWLRRHRTRGAAGLRLREALAIFERLGARPWAERAHRELRAAGQSAPPIAALVGEDLTAQERQVALTVATGLSNKETAAQLFLSPKTVEFHLSAVYRKLGISSRTKLAVLVADQHTEAS